MLRESLEAVEERIQGACRRAGRRRDEVMLVAVSKVFPAESICEAWALGLREFGENYVQEFEGKAPVVAGLAGARFHLIGHLQSNKGQRAAALFDVVQTVDSARLARRLNDAPQRRATPLEIMIEVKLSEEQTKSGAAPEELPALVDTIALYPNLRLTGLMTMPPFTPDPEASRPYFRRLRRLTLELGLEKTSMGMSHDLEVAIEEGATLVRVGTALFGRRVRA
ncbi:MAG TPA: YggS family pyridoxal phosphate-dependent enzyme [Bryobacteraceae bacterium]|nr:YggS family pyridoxal phosphate-dependent enzyme [Bryobacteraceae bacterium]